MADRYIKRCSTSLAITEMQIKTAMSHHLTAVGTAIIDKTGYNKYGRGCGEEHEPSFTAVDWYSHYIKQCGSSSKN